MHVEQTPGKVYIYLFFIHLDFFGPSGATGMLILVCLVQVSPELSIFIFLAQIFKHLFQLSLSSILALS